MGSGASDVQGAGFQAVGLTAQGFRSCIESRIFKCFQGFEAHGSKLLEPFKAKKTKSSFASHIFGINFSMS